MVFLLILICFVSGNGIILMMILIVRVVVLLRFWYMVMFCLSWLVMCVVIILR